VGGKQGDFKQMRERERFTEHKWQIQMYLWP